MKKILIVNNDPDTMLLLQELLQMEGYQVKVNTKREELSPMLKSFEPNLVLMDITRQEVMDEIYYQASKNGVPVLLMTGHNNYPVKNENGFKDFIKKPFTMDELMKKIESVLNSDAARKSWR